ncbi:MAG TPA: hypothetical protein VFW57_05660 [Acidimicrobiia bacterium]|nr:hypothetical protein [Acidimicrobiia bacterium]
MTPDATTTETAWRGVADQLASALRATILRNPTVSARDYSQAEAALGRYEQAGGQQPVELPDPPAD